ncbi:hypothetical protein VKI21_04080 [Cyanobacterium aponinum UTEX 3222]|nr:hypothetical protein VKI21_04080 [Cyanobacterium aponinum UTEX 3222]
MRSPFFAPEKSYCQQLSFQVNINIIRDAIASGIDLFDCAIPTCLGRHGATLVQGEQTKVADAPKLNRLSVGKHVILFVVLK